VTYAVFRLIPHVYGTFRDRAAHREATSHVNERVQHISVLTSHRIGQLGDSLRASQIATVSSGATTVADEGSGACLRLLAPSIDQDQRRTELRECACHDLANLALGADAGQQNGRCAEHCALRMARFAVGD
jgi:hypothetical protein